MTAPRVDLSGKKVLVTGGTGFIGGRLVERLILDCRANVRVLVSSFGNLSRIARMPVEFVHGDITSQEQVQDAASGCDIIFHCAYGSRGSDKERRQVTVGGTRNIAEAAHTQGIERLIHVSTMMVYGKTGDGDLDETAPRRKMGDWYPDSKIEAEKLVFEQIKARSLPATIVQPTVVYGPYSPPFTVGILQRLHKKRIILINGGEGLCNAVYVDDLVSAMLLAAVRKEAVGEAFLVSGAEPVTWREFFACFEKMLNIDGTVSMAPEEALAYYRQGKKATGAVRRLCRAAAANPRVRRRVTRLPAGNIAMRLVDRVGNVSPAPPGVEAETSGNTAKPIHPLLPYQIDFYQAKTRVRIDKAVRLLGYDPAFDLAAGMALTGKWASWANLLGDRQLHLGGHWTDADEHQAERHHPLLQRG